MEANFNFVLMLFHKVRVCCDCVGWGRRAIRQAKPTPTAHRNKESVSKKGGGRKIPPGHILPPQPIFFTFLTATSCGHQHEEFQKWTKPTTYVFVRQYTWNSEFHMIE